MELLKKQGGLQPFSRVAGLLVLNITGFGTVFIIFMKQILQ